MAVTKLPIIDYERLFKDDPSARTLDTDEMYYGNMKVSEYIQQIFMEDNGEGITMIARCKCGHLEGNYFEGATCPKCKTVAKKEVSEDLTFKLWLSVPDNIPPLMNPAAYRVINKWLGKKLTMLLDISSEIDADIAHLGQGYYNFYENFDAIVNFFLYEYRPYQRKQNLNKSLYIKEFIMMYRDVIFTTKLPILNNSLHVITSLGSTKKTDNSARFIQDALSDLTAAIYHSKGEYRRDNHMEQYMLTVQNHYNEYVTSIIKSKVTGKPGLIRKYILGCRMHFSCRGVISLMCEPAMGDEIHMSWRHGLIMLKLEILNILQRRYNLTLNESMYKYSVAMNRYDKDIDDIFKTLIAENPYKGLPCITGRNPTMILGGEQLTFVTKFKTDLTDDTISICDLIISAPNGDFDGDALYFGMIKENAMVECMMNVHPQQTMLSSDTCTISDYVGIGKSRSILVQEWLFSDLEN